jgi:glucose-1-phosphate cytidylyltransferase
MKVVILAGGFGTRLGSEGGLIPKPMVEIGPEPILWHIMRYYAHFGLKEFVVALGYQSLFVKRYFFEFEHLYGDLVFDMKRRQVERMGSHELDWRVHLAETGLHTMTGGRVRRLAEYLGDEPFMLTYGDGVGDVDLNALAEFHKEQGLSATVTVVRPPSRFGGVYIEDQRAAFFVEKAQVDVGWINGGFMVLEPSVLDYLSADEDVFEIAVLERLAKEGQLAAFRHNGFWQCMDTPKEKKYLNDIWERGEAPWCVWEQNESK